MLMAAGLGTRLRPFTDRTPKALIPVLGIPVAQFAIDALAQAGVHRVVANVHHLADRAIMGLHGLDCARLDLAISDERETLLGSGGGIREALPLLGEGAFFLVNADVLSDVDLRRLAYRHLKLRRQWNVSMTLALFERAPSGGKYREVRVDAAGERIVGLGQLESERPFFIGAAVIESEAVAGLARGPSEFVPMILEPAIRAGRAGAWVTQGRWHDVGDPHSWLSTQLELARGLRTGRIPTSWRRRIESTQASRRLVIDVEQRRVIYPDAESVAPMEGAGIGYGGQWVGEGI